MYPPKNKNIFSTIAIAVIVALGATIFWLFGDKFVHFITELVSPQEATFAWWKLLVVIAAGAIFGLLAEFRGFKKTLPFFTVFAIACLLASLLFAKYLNIDLLAIPIILTSLLSLILVHLKKLWHMDTGLTDKLVSLASSGHLLEGKSADLRIESGLKLLETIFPVSEIIVFHYDHNDELRPIGRARKNKADNSPSNRHDSWRKCVELCEQALGSRSTVIQNHKTSQDAAQVALPLICDEIAIGVLFIDVKQDFEKEDQHLLESFSGQLARNLQRKELRSKKLPHNSWFNSLSTYSLENRIDITSLVQGIIKEQSFSAVASSYLKEAHAIAYLDGTLAYANRLMKDLADLKQQDLADLDVFKLLERFKTDVFNEPTLAIRRVMQTGDSFRCELDFPEEMKTLSFQITLVKIPVDNQSIHETDVPKVPACFLITFRDITANKENEKLRSDMAHLMSHELRTPITSIQGFAEMLMLEDGIPEDSKDFLKTIADESNRASKILSNFLSVANLEQADKKEVSKSPVRVNKVVRDVVQDYEKKAKGKRIRLVEQQSKYVAPIAADRGLLTKAIAHLVDNAIRYSPERTSVIISTILETDFLKVVVEDRGYGIPRDEQEKIWQKFYRVAHDGQAKQEETTGLGLSLVKEIIEQHNGDISVRSEVGRGSRFVFRLPRL